MSSVYPRHVWEHGKNAPSAMRPLSIFAGSDHSSLILQCEPPFRMSLVPLSPSTAHKPHQYPFLAPLGCHTQTRLFLKHFETSAYPQRQNVRILLLWGYPELN